MKRSIFGLLLAISLAVPVAAAAAPAVVQTEHARAELHAEHRTVAPGDGTWLALRLRPREGWHTYWKNPGDSGEATRLDWRVPDGVATGPIVWPIPERIPFGPFVNFGYHGAPVHLVRLDVPSDWPVGRSLRVDLHARWLVCEEICIPEEARLGIDLEVADTARSARPEVAEIFAVARRELPQATSMSGSYQIEDGALRLELPRREPLRDIERGEVFFFPEDWGSIEPSAPQAWSTGADGLVGELKAGPSPATSILRGVAVLDRADGGAREAIRVEARPSPAPSPSVSADPAPALGLWQALLLALAGGVLLNLMPCVLPVLSIKVLGLIRHGRSHGALRASGLAYTAGVLCCFALLAVLLVGLRSAGVAAGWGFQLQSPGFVAAMSYLLFTMGLVLLMDLNLGAGMAGLGDDLARRQGAVGSFFTGALAAVVATPCTAPFMAVAIGFALSQPIGVAVTILLAVGLGLALPYLTLTFVPAWTRWLPRPGAWMVRLKQALAFPLFGTVVWLLWVAGRQIGTDGLARILVGLLLLALALWVYAGWRSDSGRTPWPAAAAAVALVVGAVALISAPMYTVTPLSAESAQSSVPFDESEIQRLRVAGHPVFVNMTAAWCITCLVNERVALDTDDVRAAMRSRGIFYMKGDWTNRDARIRQYLGSFGRAGVPLYVLYPAGKGAPVVLPQILTEKTLLQAFEALPSATGSG